MVQSLGRDGGAAAGVPLKGGWVGKNNPYGRVAGFVVEHPP